MQPALYMVALVPDAYLADIIGSIRKEFAATFGPKAALRPPVHVTLYPPFKMEPEKEPVLKEGLQAVAAQAAPFRTELRDYGFFRNEVVFLNVVLNDALLQLHRQVTDFFGQALPSAAGALQFPDYHPHITIGYRDIPERLFPAIRERYTTLQFRDAFTVSAFFLWKHNGKHWEVLAAFPFGRALR